MPRTFTPTLLRDLFDMKLVTAKIADNRRFLHGTFHVKAERGRRATLSVILHGAPGPNQLALTSDNAILPVTQAMLDKVNLPSRAGIFHADWRDFAERIRAARLT